MSRDYKLTWYLSSNIRRVSSVVRSLQSETTVESLQNFVTLKVNSGTQLCLASSGSPREKPCVASGITNGVRTGFHSAGIANHVLAALWSFYKQLVLEHLRGIRIFEARSPVMRRSLAILAT
jgi:hypothetical protein